MISVVIPLYNKASTIRRCLNSVFNQTILPNELIIINDGSTDNSLNVLNEFLNEVSLEALDIKVRVIDQENSGVSFTRNKGVSLAKNNFIAFLDADDEWHKEYIENAQSLISKHQKISMFTCRHEICDVNIGKYIPEQKFGSSSTGIINNYLFLAKSYPIINSSKVVVNKPLFELVGGFPEKAKVSEDLFLWIKLSECGSIVYSDKLLVTIHQAVDQSRDSRVGEVPYPIIYYTRNKIDPNLNSDLLSFLWSIHFKHVLGSCATNKKEALKRALYGLNLFGFRGALLLFFLFVPKCIFGYLRKKRRYKMVKSNV